MEKLKRCSKCGECKSLELFNKNKSKKDGHDCYCKSCNRIRKKKYSGNKYSNYDRKYELKRKFDITLEQYNQMLSAQNNECPICHRHKDELKKAMCVDHDHITGEIRGLLCIKCNLRLGTFNDNIEDLKSAILYLEKYKKQ